METLAMSKKERRRLELFSQVRDGELTLVKASELLGLIRSACCASARAPSTSPNSSRSWARLAHR